MTAQIISALPIPFRTDGSIEWDSYDQLLQHVAPYVHGVLVAGTTGEFPALEDDERIAAFSKAVSVLGAKRVIAHIGHASPGQVIRLGEAAKALGITRLATLNPYYLPADDAAVYSFYETVASALPGMDHYVYLFPERTGITVSTAVFGRIMQLPDMRGVKLSGAASEKLEAYAAELQPGQELYSGNDATLPFVMNSGGTGVVSGVSAAFPETFARLSSALADSEVAQLGEQTEAINNLQSTVERLVSLTGPSIVRLKAAVSVNVLGVWSTRMPMASIDEGLRAELTTAATNNS